MRIFKKEILSTSLRADILSGFLVFLIALPLSLGIAKASGFPPIAGIYSAIVGGLLATFFSDARLAIKGPAAGLIVIALGAFEALGYKGALACIAIAGVFQVLFAFLKVGNFSDFFPSSAVHGLLAAIGIIIISKQMAGVFGVTTLHKNPIALLIEIPSMISNLNPKIALLGIGSLVVLFSWQFMPKIIQKVPAQVVVLFITVLLGYYFELHIAHKYIFNDTAYQIRPEKILVTLPSDITAGLTLPNWSQLISFEALKYVIMFALIGSLESVLSAKAVDSLDPSKQKTNYNKDLLAVGISNTLLGFIGGLPLITEIVRSSANIDNGAKTRLANFFHSLWMLLFVVLASSLINHIPVAALAAMLVFTGYNLASPQKFKHTYQIGKEQFVIFCTTIMVTLATDLLIGITVGILTKLILEKILSEKMPISYLFKTHTTITKKSNTTYYIKIENAAVFSNYLGFKDKIKDIPLSANWIIDVKEAKVIDHTFMEQLLEKKAEIIETGGKINFLHLEELVPLSKHPAAARIKKTI